jgi:hypothetical protein
MLPILILTYQRLDLLKQCLQKILEQEHGSIYVHCDGPLDTEIQILNNLKIRAYIDELSESGQIDHSLFQEKNLGLNTGVMSGIDWFFRNERVGIIVEEDLKLHAPILEITENLLPLLTVDKKASAINLRNTVPPDRILEPGATYRYSSMTSSHGWVTTREVWQSMPRSLDGWEDRLNFRSLRTRYGYISAKSLSMRIAEQFSLEKNGKRNASWDCKWSVYFPSTDRISLNLNLNLVEYIGFDPLSMNHRRPEFGSKITVWSGGDHVVSTEILHPDSKVSDLRADRFRMRYELKNSFSRFLFRLFRMNKVVRIFRVTWNSN